MGWILDWIQTKLIAKMEIRAQSVLDRVALPKILAL